MTMEMSLEVPFRTRRHAEIVCNSLRVDPEPRRSGLEKELSVKDNSLVASFRSRDARSLRVGVNSFFDLLRLAIQTVEEFDVGRDQ